MDGDAGHGAWLEEGVRMGRTLRVLVAVLGMAFGLTAAGDVEAACTVRACRNEIASCRSILGCDELTPRRVKRACRKGCKVATRRTCKEGLLDCSASPSGAFLDGLD